MTDMTDSAVSHPRKRRFRVVALLAIVLAVAAFFIWREYFQTYHLVVVDPGKLYRDGNRSLREFRNTLRKTKPRTVIAIVDQQEYNESEFVAARELVKSRGLEFHWIPIKAGAYPTGAQVKEFLAIASDPAQQPVLYHDDEGIRRAGMMMAAYQETVLGYDNEKTKASIKAFGHSDRTINEVRRFIDAYDPVRGLTVDLNPRPATTTTTTAPVGE